MSALSFASLSEPKPDARLAGMMPRDFHDAGTLATRPPLCEAHPGEAPNRIRQAAPDLPAGDLIRSDEDLVVRLCRLPVDLSAPLLRSTLPNLTPQALLALIAATGEGHHRLIAARPGLDWRVIKALIRSQNDGVIAALIRNSTLMFDDEDQHCFAGRALENAEVRAAVLAHEGLPVAKSQLRLNYGDGQAHGNLKLVALVRGGAAAGFVREIARRLKVDMIGLSRVLASESAVPLALALCAAGVDRAVFLYILSVWQGSYEAAPQMTAGQRPLVLSIFNLTAAEARRRLAALIDRAH